MDLRDLIAAPGEERVVAEVGDPRLPRTRPRANPDLDVLELMFGIERLDTVLGR